VSDPAPLDSGWIAANALPVHGGGTDKNSRGRVLAIGGSALSPGALRLTGEAALRVGAGKVQMATLSAAAMMLGLLVPEAGVLALPEQDGEIGAAEDALRKPLGNTDAVVIGPGMASSDAAAALVRLAVDTTGDDTRLVLDAAAIASASGLRNELARVVGRVVMTPHYGEMAALTGRSVEDITDDPAATARMAATEFGAVIALKGSDTIIAAPDGSLLSYAGGGVGLATGGSGDVLAGVVAGLLARGADPLLATGWAVWLHGHSGRRMMARHGPIGFLARELLPEIPRLLPQ
jgi:ADP-dependent NAD(P)H-hydrate dehydratase